MPSWRPAMPLSPLARPRSRTRRSRCRTPASRRRGRLAVILRTWHRSGLVLDETVVRPGRAPTPRIEEGKVDRRFAAAIRLGLPSATRPGPEVEMLDLGLHRWEDHLIGAG